MQNDPKMRDINIAITAASYSGNKGAAAMLQSSIPTRVGNAMERQSCCMYESDNVVSTANTEAPSTTTRCGCAVPSPPVSAKWTGSESALDT